MEYVKKPELSDFNLTEEDLPRCEDGRYLRMRNKLKNRDARNFGICALVFFLCFAAFLIVDYLYSGIFDYEAENGGIAWFSVIDGCLFTLFVCFLERWFLALERYAKSQEGREFSRKAEAVAFGVLAGVFFACVAAYVISYFAYWHDLSVSRNGYFAYDSQTTRFVCITVCYSVLTLSAFSAAVHISRKGKRASENAPEDTEEAIEEESLKERYRAYLTAVKDYGEYEKKLGETNKSFWSDLPLYELKERFTYLLAHLGYGSETSGDALIFVKEGEKFAVGFKTGRPASAADIKAFIETLPPLRRFDRAVFVSVGGFGFPLDRLSTACGNVRTYAENKGVNLVLWTVGDLLHVAYDAGATIYDEDVLPEALMPVSLGPGEDDGFVTLGSGEDKRRFGMIRRRNSKKG